MRAAFGSSHSYDPITPIRSIYQQPGPLNLPSPGLSPDNVHHNVQQSTSTRNDCRTPQNNPVANGTDHSLTKSPVNAVEIQSISSRLFKEDDNFTTEQNEVRRRMLPQHDIVESDAVSFISDNNDDDEDDVFADMSLLEGGDISTRSLHAMSLLPETPPRGSWSEQGTPDTQRASSQYKSPAQALAPTPLRGIMKKPSAVGKSQTFTDDSRARNRRLIEDIQEKYGGARRFDSAPAGIAAPAWDHSSPAQPQPQSSFAESLASASAEQDEASLRALEELLANTALNTTPAKSRPSITSAVKRTGTPARSSAYFRGRLDDSQQQQHLSEMSLLSERSAADTDCDVSYATPKKNGHMGTQGATQSVHHPLPTAGLAIGATYTLTVDAHGSPVFVPVHYAMASSGRAPPLRAARDDSSVSYSLHGWRGSSGPGGASSSLHSMSYLPPSALQSTGERRFHWEEAHRLLDDRALYQDDDDSSRYHRRPVDHPRQSARGEQRFPASFYSSLLADSEEAARFPHMAPLAERRAFSAWRDLAAATSDEYYYARSKFREPPLPRFQSSRFPHSTDVRSTYPLSGSSSSGADWRYSWDDLPRANVYSRNISKTLSPSKAITAAASAHRRGMDSSGGGERQRHLSPSYTGSGGGGFHTPAAEVALFPMSAVSVASPGYQLRVGADLREHLMPTSQHFRDRVAAWRPLADTSVRVH